MSITPATLNDASLKNNFSLVASSPLAGTFSVFPSYFRTLTQFSPPMSPRRSRRNHAAQKSLSPRIALGPSVSAGI
jgi:hypothetical protein